MRDIIRKSMKQHGMKDEEIAKLMDVQERPADAYEPPPSFRGEAFESYDFSFQSDMRSDQQRRQDGYRKLSELLRDKHEDESRAHAEALAKEQRYREMRDFIFDPKKDHKGTKSCQFCKDAVEKDEKYVPCWVRQQAVDIEVVHEPAPVIMLGCESDPGGNKNGSSTAEHT